MSPGICLPCAFTEIFSPCADTDNAAFPVMVMLSEKGIVQPLSTGIRQTGKSRLSVCYIMV